MWGLNIHVILYLIQIYSLTKYLVENAVNNISETLDFKIFWGSLPQDPPTVGRKQSLPHFLCSNATETPGIGTGTLTTKAKLCCSPSCTFGHGLVCWKDVWTGLLKVLLLLRNKCLSEQILWLSIVLPLCHMDTKIHVSTHSYNTITGRAQ